jgi:hypothetical protein
LHRRGPDPCNEQPRRFSPTLRETGRTPRPHRPSTPSREEQQQLLGIALAYIEEQTALRTAVDQGEFMINRVVEVSETGSCADYPLPVS